jgi:hypothetical protein
MIWMGSGRRRAGENLCRHADGHRSALAELTKRGEDVQHQPPDRAGGVDILGPLGGTMLDPFMGWSTSYRRTT